LLRPPTPKPTDKIVYLFCAISTAILAAAVSVLKKKKIKDSIFIVFPRLMWKDLLIVFSSVVFIARKRRTDILILNNLSEPWMKHYFKPNSGDVVIDIGAHVGKYSLVAARSVGERGTVIAIEAHPENFNALLNNMHLNRFRNMIALNVAAFNEDGKKMRLYGFRDNSYSLKSLEGVEVETRTVDSILKEYPSRRVDWVKIDVEGAEVQVLEGMKDIIKNNQNLKILIEVHGENIYPVQKILRDFQRKILGGDDPNIPVMFFWREGIFRNP